MNIGRGAFRLCVVFAVLWVGLFGYLGLYAAQIDVECTLGTELSNCFPNPIDHLVGIIELVAGPPIAVLLFGLALLGLREAAMRIARSDRRRPEKLRAPYALASDPRSAPDLEPSKGEQDERYYERSDRVLASNVIGARREPREKRGKTTHWNQPVRGGDGKEQDAKKPGDQRQGSVHRAEHTREPQIFR